MASAAARAKPARKPSPSRPESEDTFKRKVDEVKRMRAMAKNYNGEHQQKEQRKNMVTTVVNGKAAVAVQGDWATFSSSSSAGKIYYFNLKTLVNQWTRPAEWVDDADQQSRSEEGRAADPPLPPQTEPPPLPAEPAAVANGFRMRVKKAGGRLKRKRPRQRAEPPPQQGGDPPPPPEEAEEDRVPRAYQSSSSSSSSSSGHDSSGGEEDPTRSGGGASPLHASTTVPPAARSCPPPPEDRALQAAVLAAKAKIESQLPAAASAAPPPPLLPPPPASAALNNPTWLTEYNFPAVLSRCKFPKTQDALHELGTNRSKRRPEPNMAPLPHELSAFAGASELDDVRRDMFVAELKNSNNRHRLLTEKLNGVAVFRIPDDLWERNAPALFSADLLGPSVRLEARPHGLTDDNVPVYTRTGKVATKLPFPEDVVRCHAVIQTWRTETCHCVYANKIFTIERDDKQWKKDLEECRKFLVENGY